MNQFCTIENNVYFSGAKLCIPQGKNISIAPSFRVDFISYLVGIIQHSARSRGISGSKTASSHQKASTRLNCNRRKIQATCENLTTWCVISLKANSCTLTLKGRLDFASRVFSIKHSKSSKIITLKRFLCY